MAKKKYSSFVTNGTDKAPNRAMLRAVGFENDDFNKPIIGIASTWAMVTPCVHDESKNRSGTALPERAINWRPVAGTKWDA